MNGIAKQSLEGEERIEWRTPGVGTSKPWARTRSGTLRQTRARNSVGEYPYWLDCPLVSHLYPPKDAIYKDRPGVLQIADCSLPLLDDWISGINIKGLAQIMKTEN